MWGCLAVGQGQPPPVFFGTHHGACNDRFEHCIAVVNNWQASVLVMELASFTVSGFLWLLLFAVLLITLFHCAWENFGKSNGYVSGLAYSPVNDAILVLCELSCGANEGLLLPLLFWH